MISNFYLSVAARKNCLRRSVPEIHLHVAGTLNSNNKQTKLIFDGNRKFMTETLLYVFGSVNTILTPGRPVPALTLSRQAPGRVATGVPIFKSLV